jgi:hypothetical protein
LVVLDRDRVDVSNEWQHVGGCIFQKNEEVEIAVGE